MSERLSVLYVPYYGDSNEYQNLLTDSVADRGVDPVEGEMHLLFPLVRNTLGNDIDVIHLIWTHPFFIVGDYTGSAVVDTVASYVRAALFLFDLFLVRLLDIDLVWTAHNKANHEKHHLGLDHFVSRRLAGMADKMTVECECAKNTIVDLFRVDNPSKIHIISEGSYIGSYADETDYEAAREHLGIDDNEFCFVYFGMIRTYKRVPHLIDVYDGLGIDSASLLVAGNPYTEDIELDLRRRVDGMDGVRTRFEFIPNDEVQYYMHAADIVVLPYEDIMTSGSVILAMSFGRPVIAPAIGCIPAVTDEDGSFLYEQSDPNGLRDAMVAAHETGHEELESMGSYNYERAEALEWSAVGESTVEVYRRAIQA
ncbi:glycosyltransferase [Haloarchaeobius sp. DT45]|uniref:glycosyltransferase n=1 Tax=Haloarchaeobius sp. DT45 TaxID=3446116 RepID=UPI003F6BD6B8